MSTSTITQSTVTDRHPLALPTDSPEDARTAMGMPLTILGLGERFALHYGDHTAYIGGVWKVAVTAGEWDHLTDTEALEYCTTAALSVVRSISTTEHHEVGQAGGYNAAIKHRAAGARFEDMENIAPRILAAARHLVQHEEFSEV